MWRARKTTGSAAIARRGRRLTSRQTTQQAATVERNYQACDENGIKNDISTTTKEIRIVIQVLSDHKNFSDIAMKLLEMFTMVNDE